MEEKNASNFSSKLKGFFQFMKGFISMSKKEMVVSIVVLLSLLLTLGQFHLSHAFGSAIVGLLSGFFMMDEIKDLFKDFRVIVQRNNQFKTVLVGGLLISAFIAVPLLFIGLCAGVGVKSMFR